jgi:hypothetical protein
MSNPHDPTTEERTEEREASASQEGVTTLAPPPPPALSASSARRWTIGGRRYALAGLGALAAAASWKASPSPTSRERVDAVAELLRTNKGWTVEREDVVFLDRPSGLLGSAFGSARAIVRAKVDPAEPADLYLVDVRLTPRGALLAIGSEHNLSATTGADESRPIVAGSTVVFASQSGIEGAPSIVTALDFAGQPALDWPFRERIQNAITNWQDTGQPRGLRRSSFVVTSQSEVRLLLDEGHVVVESDGRRADLPIFAESKSGLPEWISVESTELARPGNVVTWAVDRVRAEIGDDRMQAIKQVAFTAKEFVDRNREEITGNTGEADIADDLGTSQLSAPERALTTDPDIGWPPAPLEPWIKPPLPGEGQWNAKDEEGFFRNQPNLPPTFLTTFIRSDESRKATRVYVVLWDPRQVELHMMAGTVEPKSATGKAGPGLIPRTPDVMKRVVAATNAGFQALHGEYGMMADGVVYLPPKPYAATVAKLRDGSTAFGTWPDDPSVPEDVVSYRQNMTVMVQDEKWNPYSRTWWGGTVPGAEDKTHTVRTGICLTREGFVAYFYGADLSPESLGRAMMQTRCSYGLALDMNAGHSGLEFYKVAPTAELGELARPLETSWEAEGDVPDMPGYRFRAKRLVKGMGLMNFPRYIKREARDFFFLTLRHVLPGDNLAVVASPATEGEGVWRVKGLPQHGFPYAVAVTSLRPDAADPVPRFTVLATDPRTLTPVAGNADDGAGATVFTVDAGAPRADSSSVWWSNRSFVVSGEAPTMDAVRVALGSAAPKSGAAVLGIHDESGMLYYAELQGAAEGKKASLEAMSSYLAKLGCSERLHLDEAIGLVLGDNTTLEGGLRHASKSATSVRFARAQAPRGSRFFESTPVVGRDVWYPLQQHRVRYFKKQD